MGPAARASGTRGCWWTCPQRGISRHVVRFVADGGHVFALKEIQERLARREYRLLGRFREEGLPTVSAVGICLDRPRGQEAVLVTRYLENSMSFRWLFSRPRGAHPADQLLDTLVELLVRLHLAGVFWGDCSLSNTLFRHDAGALTAYLVDAETIEQHRRSRQGSAPTTSTSPASAWVRRCWTCGSAACSSRTWTPPTPPTASAALRLALEGGHPRGGLQQRRAELAR